MQKRLFICCIWSRLRSCVLSAKHMGNPNACYSRNNTRNNNLLQKVGVDCENSIIKKFILSVSKASYGMYLSHVFFITLANYYLANIPLTGTQNALLIVVVSIIIFLSSWILIVITSKIPLIKKVCGYH